jgi:hypothetical protein
VAGEIPVAWIAATPTEYGVDAVKPETTATRGPEPFTSPDAIGELRQVRSA